MSQKSNEPNKTGYSYGDDTAFTDLVKPIELDLQDPERETYDLDERVRKFCERLNKPQTVYVTQDMFSNWSVRHKPTR